VKPTASASPVEFLIYNVPIAVPFAAFFLERYRDRAIRPRAGFAIDALVLVLALARVFIPPFPYASGHTLFTAYAAATADRWPLRASAALVLIEVAVIKLFFTGGWVSFVAGLVLAAILGLVHRRIVQLPR
jgi:hypothetical protein